MLVIVSKLPSCFDGLAWMDSMYLILNITKVIVVILPASSDFQARAKDVIIHLIISMSK